MIIENTKIGRKNYEKTHKISYDYKIFNENIINVIKTVNLIDLELELFKNIIPTQENSEKFYEKMKEQINKILKKVLSSKAAISFFNNTYKKCYEEHYGKNIEYLFNDENEQNDILKRMAFYPIYNEGIDGFTNPSDLTIFINSIPGKFYQNYKINYFNKFILQISRIVIICIHEIMGHFMRRYYSYITDGYISIDTKEDSIIETRPEGGENAEKNFLGFRRPNLYLRDALCFFYSGDFEKYPLFDNIVIDKKSLKNMINDKNNAGIFDFILLKEKKDEEKK